MDIPKKFSTKKNVFIDRMCLYFALLFLLAVIGNAGLSRTALGKFFKSYLCFENDVLFSNANDTRKKKFRVLPTGAEPTTFRLLVRMLCH